MDIKEGMVLTGTDGRKYELLMKGVSMFLVRQYITPIPGRVIDTWEPMDAFAKATGGQP